MLIAKEGNRPSTILATSRTKLQTYRWISWMIGDNLNFCFVEKTNTRANTKNGVHPISRSTLMKYIHLISSDVLSWCRAHRLALFVKSLLGIDAEERDE